MLTPSKDAIGKRLRDAQEGVDFGTPPDAPLPHISDLGLPSPIRKQLETLCTSHAKLGQIRRDAETDQKALTETIKGLLADHLSDDTPSFLCADVRVSYYPQRRTRFDQMICRTTLVTLGVKPIIVEKAMRAAVLVSEVQTLRITPQGEADAE